MNTNQWYTFESAIDEKTCNKIKKSVAQWEPTTVATPRNITDEERKTGIKPAYKSDPEYRKSEVTWCSDQWLYDLIWPYMERGNHDAGWKYNIRAAEPNQITRYGEGGYYEFHTDGLGDHLSAYDSSCGPFLSGHVRKLSMSVLLNDNFEGGDFEFATYSKEKCTITSIPTKAGSIILFPAAQEHRVAPVREGTRYSLVTWFLGPPFV